ncbi:GNAT family N-acetyltransferase [Dactylosporangium sp. NPDC000555]|uniref:GNAT family N-acetyltransferase n=1 Tax=Dactylosporangium sp. NPDC000555 TaxID=3154260 RepID=UPI003324856E
MPLLAEDVVPPGTLATMPQPALPADGLTLRPWRAEDRPAVVAAYADPAIQQWHCRTMNDDEAAAWLSAWPSRWRAESGAGWAVTDGEEVVGQVSLRTLDLPAGLAEVSYWVLPSRRGLRIAPRALAALTAWSFGSLGLHRIELRHSVSNPNSCRVATLAGYAPEGVQRGGCMHPDGWHDMHLHARLDTDP